MTNLPSETLVTPSKDKSYLVAGYRLSDIASADISKKEYDAFEEITGKPVKRFAEIHAISIFGKVLPLPVDKIHDDPSDPLIWVKNLFGLTAIFSERWDNQAKGLLRYNFRSIIIGSIVASNGFGVNNVCDPKSGGISFKGTEKICKIPETSAYTYAVKKTFIHFCEKLELKIPTGFVEPSLFMV